MLQFKKNILKCFRSNFIFTLALGLLWIIDVFLYIWKVFTFQSSIYVSLSSGSFNIHFFFRFSIYLSSTRLPWVFKELMVYFGVQVVENVNWIESFFCRFCYEIDQYVRVKWLIFYAKIERTWTMSLILYKYLFMPLFIQKLENAHTVCVNAEWPIFQSVWERVMWWCENVNVIVYLNNENYKWLRLITIILANVLGILIQFDRSKPFHYFFFFVLQYVLTPFCSLKWYISMKSHQNKTKYKTSCLKPFEAH